MPTLYKWIYTGGADGSTAAKRRGEQRALAGDAVVHDVFGAAKLDGLEGGKVLLQVGSGEARLVKKCGAGLVYALASREERPPRRATGRSAAGAGSISAFMSHGAGAAGAVVTLGRGSCRQGRHKGAGKGTYT
eukprot:scaffold10016_cov112-Isochrysis_galbana.AAC.1